jgi:hypothetical protein
MTRRWLFRSLGATLAVSSRLLAQEEKHPNFSGRWRMVKDASDFGKFNPPDLVVRVVDQRGTTMNVHTVQTKGKNTTSSDVSYFTSGDIATNTLAGRDAQSKAFWDGNTLVIRTATTDSKNEEEHIVDRWDLSPDGNTLTVTSHIETESGGADLKLVCRRETVTR